MKRILSCLTLAFLFCSISNAQYLNYEIREVMDYFRNNQMITDKAPNTLTENDIKGSPYMDDAFAKGTIYTSSKTKVVGIPLRYNIFNDNLEFKTPSGQILALSTPESVERAEFNKIILEFTRFEKANKIKQGFLRVIQKGKVSLLSKSTIHYQKPIQEKAYKEAQPAKFIPKPEVFYLQLENQPALKIKGKKELLSILSDHPKEISTFLKKNKIKLSKEQDLHKLVNYYNSL